MTGLSKTRGPLSGGSEISIIGENINIGSRQRVAIRLTDGSSIPCDITSRNQAANKYDYYMFFLRMKFSDWKILEWWESPTH